MQKIYFTTLFFFISLSLLGQVPPLKFENSGVFDASGRQVVLRGFNVSGGAKLKETSFLPFFSFMDAKRSFKLLNEQGSNIVRLTLSWEGAFPSKENIFGGPDELYLDRYADFIKEAVLQNIFVLVDFHQDLFASYLFSKNSKFQGNGAPEWLEAYLPKKNKFCYFCVHWSQNLLTNPAVKGAYKAFWENLPVCHQDRCQGMLDLYSDHVVLVMEGLAKRLGPLMNWVVGVDPINEPAGGTIRKKHMDKVEEKSLWPFYLKVNQRLKALGFKNQYVFAEPFVTWNSNLFLISHLKGIARKDELPDGIIFNSHLYDAKRMGLPLTAVSIDEYSKAISEMLNLAKRLNVPAFLSEYGHSLDKKGFKDTHAIIYAMKTAIDTAAPFQSGGRIPFQTQNLGATQWQWDIHYNTYEAGQFDGWNKENFSVIGEYGNQFNIDYGLLDRAYPKVLQGKLLHFYAQENVLNKKGVLLSPGRLSLEGEYYLIDSPFYFMAYSPKLGILPTQVHIPSKWIKEGLTIMDSKGIHKVTSQPSYGNYYLIGNTLNFYPSPQASLDFLLIMPGLNEMKLPKKEDIMQSLYNQQSPVWLADF